MLACACAYECNRFCVSACAVWCSEDESGACHALTGSVINYSFLLVHAQTHYEDPVRLSRFTTAWSSGYQTSGRVLRTHCSTLPGYGCTKGGRAVEESLLGHYK